MPELFVPMFAFFGCFVVCGFAAMPGEYNLRTPRHRFCAYFCSVSFILACAFAGGLMATYTPPFGAH